MENTKNFRFASETTDQTTELGIVPRSFHEHGETIVLLCDDAYEDGVPFGEISVTKAGIRIKLYEEERTFPVHVTRQIIKSA